ncbi:hypothetical protein LEMLEM_LOCUS6191 [Lemmus lemmus]
MKMYIKKKRRNINIQVFAAHYNVLKKQQSSIFVMVYVTDSNLKCQSTPFSYPPL